MKPAFLKKHTKGGAAGLSWEAGEVKALHPALAEELAMLSPDDYEMVQEGEYTPEAPAHNPPGFVLPVTSSDGEGIKVKQPGSSVVEDVVPGSAEENEGTAQALTAAPSKAKSAAKKSNKTTETPSAE